eukprot:Lankesteria_metandrocarpae@DN2284_c0_g1_i2.p1
MSVPPNEGSAVLQHPIVSVSVEWRRDLLRIALERQALRFGQFTLKSGRRSPYFFNSGRFDDGASFSALCAAYAQGIVEAVTSGALPEFDVLYGPAYKGIPLVAGVTMCLAREHNQNYSFIYNRKEAKTHGEGGTIVGMTVDTLVSQRVLLIDDVLTAGTAVGEAIGALSTYAVVNGVAPPPTVVGVVIALDRQETAGPQQPTTAAKCDAVATAASTAVTCTAATSAASTAAATAATAAVATAAATA